MLTALKTTQSHVANPCAVRGEARELENTTSAHVFSPEPGGHKHKRLLGQSERHAHWHKRDSRIFVHRFTKGGTSPGKPPSCFFAQLIPQGTSGWGAGSCSIWMVFS